jgi:hypothetical protein
VTPDSLTLLLTDEVRLEANIHRFSHVPWQNVIVAAVAPALEQQANALKNIAMCARRAYGYGHRATPKSDAEMLKFRDEMLGHIIAFCNAAGATGGSILREDVSSAAMSATCATPASAAPATREGQ